MLFFLLIGLFFVFFGDELLSAVGKLLVGLIAILYVSEAIKSAQKTPEQVSSEVCVTSIKRELGWRTEIKNKGIVRKEGGYFVHPLTIRTSPMSQWVKVQCTSSLEQVQSFKIIGEGG